MAEQGLKYNAAKAGIAFPALVCSLIYLLLPTSNHSGDALGYAASPDPGPHHLLYDLWCLLLHQLSFHNHQVMAVLTATNAIAAGMGLWIFGRLLRFGGISNPAPWIWLAAGCFGWLRFATENETYILPILFSLTGTLYLLKASQIGCNRFWPAFVLLGIAVLSHQIHIMWLLAATIWLWRNSGFKKHTVWPPLVSALLLIGAYWLAAVALEKPFVVFLRGDIGSETVQLIPGISNFLFTPVSFIRSVVQVHGNIAVFWQRYIWFRLAAAGCLLLLVYLLFLLWQFRKQIVKQPVNSKIPQLLLLVFSMQLLFAWYSEGNAEFMVMLPMILTWWLASKLKIPDKIIVVFALLLWLWNGSAALIPDHIFNYRNLDSESKWYGKYKGFYMAQNAIELTNFLQFKQGNRTTSGPEKSPADCGDTAILAHSIDSCLQLNIPVYTDCISHASAMNRKTVVNGNKNKLFFEAHHWKLQAVDSFNGFYGTVYLHRITVRHHHH